MPMVISEYRQTQGWKPRFTTIFDKLSQPFLAMNWKFDQCKFHWPGSYLDVTISVHLLLTYPNQTYPNWCVFIKLTSFSVKEKSMIFPICDDQVANLDRKSRIRAVSESWVTGIQLTYT